MALTMKILAATALLAITAFAAGPLPASAAMDEAQKKEMGEFIKQYLLENPDILIEMSNSLRDKQEEQKAAEATAALAANKDAVFADANDITLGNPNGDVTIVEFFDYNCGYCRHALPTMEELITKDKNVRFVLKEWPILGPNSVATHKVANAVRELAPEKYKAFHYALMTSDSMATEDAAMETAVSLGLKEEDVRRTMAEKPNDDIVAKTDELARSLGFTGTPGYVLPGETVNGAVPTNVLVEKIANVRSCGKATC